MNEVEDDRDDKVEVLEILEGLLVASLKSTNRVGDSCFEENRSGLGLWDEGEVDNLLDRDDSRLDSLEGKKDSSQVVNSFFETGKMLLWIGVEWNDETFLQLLKWDGFKISARNWATQVGYLTITTELLDSNESNLDSLEDENELIGNNGENKDENEEDIGNLVAMSRVTFNLDKEIGLIASISLLVLETLIYLWSPSKTNETSLESMVFSLAWANSFLMVDLDFFSRKDSSRLLSSLGDGFLISSK